MENFFFFFFQSSTHLPDFVALADEFKKKGYEPICVSVNDAFTMAAWGKANKAEGKVFSSFFFFEKKKENNSKM